MSDQSLVDELLKKVSPGANVSNETIETILDTLCERGMLNEREGSHLD